MSNDRRVTVQHAIVHITDRNEPEPVYSEIELDLEGNGELGDYFTGQVENALADDHGAANFSDRPPHEAGDACHRILDDGEALVPASQELARLLYDAMGTHPQIVPGLLAVCVYTVADHDRHLALFKLDPSSGLVQKIGRRKGKRLVTFESVPKVMPTARERLQKAALLPPRGSTTYDLLLLDRQTSEVAAAYWAKTFLNVKLIVDGRIGARTLRDVSYKASDDLVKRGLVTPAQADAVKEQADLSLKHSRVRRSAYVQTLPIPKEAKAVVAAELEKKFPGTPTIPIDVEFAAAKLTNKTKYRGDYGVVFEVETEHFDHVVQKMESFTADDGTPMTRLVLEVPRLHKVK